MIRKRGPAAPAVALVILAVLTGCSAAINGAAVVGTALATRSPNVLRETSTTASVSTPEPSTTTAPVSSTASAGEASSVPTATRTTSAPTTTAPTTTTEPTTTEPTTTASPQSFTTAPVPGSAAATAFPVCRSVPTGDYPAIVKCLQASVSDYWSGELNTVIDQPVILNPTDRDVPTGCRGGLTVAPAFTCPLNNTVYLNSSLFALAAGRFRADEVPYVIALVMAHEIGHVVQAAVDQPGYADTTSKAASRRIEQQADCLSGVWARHESRLDSGKYVEVAGAFIADISTNPEISTHGTPPQRLAAINRGLKNGRPKDCALATFS